MNLPRWFASPLAGTAAVLAGLCLLAIPLHKLTSANPPPPPVVADATDDAAKTPGVLRLRLLASARRISVKTDRGTVLLDEADLGAGESEYDTALPLDGGRLELFLEADFGGLESDTAAFLTVMPDGHEEQTRYAIGSGSLIEVLSYQWHTPQKD